MKKALRWLIPPALTILLIWYLFRIVDFHSCIEIIRRGCNLWWILFAMILSIFSHIIRAARWRIQLHHLDIRPPFMAICCSIFGAYALNLVFPRLGEVWRCTYISSRQHAPLGKVVGSFVIDRLFDTISVLLLTLLTFILARPAIESFLAKYPVGRDLISLISNPLLWIGIAAAILIALLIYRAFRESKPILKFREFLSQIWQGFADIARMPHKGLFLLLTAGIWGCYFIQLYVAFFAFPFTAALCRPDLAYGFEPCLVAFVLSSIGMAIPSNGGLGPWNIAIMFGLAIYGITDAQGAAFSIIQWTGQTIMLVILGLFTIAYTGRKNNK